MCVVSGAGANICPRKVDPLEISGHHLTTDTCTVPGSYRHRLQYVPGLAPHPTIPDNKHLTYIHFRVAQ